MFEKKKLEDIKSEVEEVDLEDENFFEEMQILIEKAATIIMNGTKKERCISNKFN